MRNKSNLNSRCYIEVCDDFIDSNETNTFTPNWLNNTIPWNDNSPDRCYHYNYTWTSLDECQYPNSSVNLEMVMKCDRWVYERSLFTNTVVTEVCCFIFITTKMVCTTIFLNIFTTV